MPATPTPYRRLTRDSAGVGTYSSLWLAADHLMIVRSTGYHESYSRVQLSDVKAIFLTKSARRIWWGVAWGVIAAPAGIVLGIGLTGREPPIFSTIFFLIGVAGLIWNHLLGAGCRAYVLTGVQTAELTSLVRINKARKVIAQLQPLLAQAQADLTLPRAVPTSGSAPETEGLTVVRSPAAAAPPSESTTPAAGAPDATPPPVG